MLPVLFHIGPIPIRSYGFMVFVGFVIALWFTRRAAALRQGPDSKIASPEINDRARGRGRRRGRSRDFAFRAPTPDDVSNVALIGLWVGIIGARLLFVVMDW